MQTGLGAPLIATGDAPPGQFSSCEICLGPPPPLDTMIADHALEFGATLIASDRALVSTPGLTVEGWLA